MYRFWKAHILHACIKLRQIRDLDNFSARRVSSETSFQCSSPIKKKFEQILFLRITCD